MAPRILSVDITLGAGLVVAAVVYHQSGDRKALKGLFAGLSSAVAAALGQVLSRAVIGLKPEAWPLQEWVGQYEEDAVEPDIAVLDAHHHMWDARVHDKGWPIGKLLIKLLYSLKPRITLTVFSSDPNNKQFIYSFGTRFPPLVPYMGADLTADITGNGRGHNVVGTVYVQCGWKTPGVDQCMWPVKEADMVTEVHSRFPNLCNGIVAHVDLRLGAAVEPALQYYQQNPLVKGIRHSLACSDDDAIVKGDCEAYNPKYDRACDRGLTLSQRAIFVAKDTAYDPKFREAFALLSKYGFSYDCWLFHENLAALTDLAKTFPDTTIICDHMGFPLGMGKHDRKETFPKWQELVKALAAQPNVNMKIGGFGMRFPGFEFDERSFPPTSNELAEAWGPYVTFCIDTFGVDRCIMESNFPMDKISCSYTVLFNALKKIVKTHSQEDKRKLFELNAKRVYRLT